MELQPRHDFQLREQSPPPSYSPPQYSPSPPPSYSSTVLHNTVAQTASDGVHTVTSLAPNEGVFLPRGQLATGMLISTLENNTFLKCSLRRVFYD
jgi:hypothetical protein